MMQPQERPATVLQVVAFGANQSRVFVFNAPPATLSSPTSKPRLISRYKLIGHKIELANIWMLQSRKLPSRMAFAIHIFTKAAILDAVVDEHARRETSDIVCVCTMEADTDYCGSILDGGKSPLYTKKVSSLYGC